MGAPLPISKLVELIGDENIKVQNLAHNLSGARQMKDCGLITFATSKEHCSEIMKAGAGLESSKVVGLILWVPTEKIDEINHLNQIT